MAGSLSTEGRLELPGVGIQKGWKVNYKARDPVVKQYRRSKSKMLPDLSI